MATSLFRATWATMGRISMASEDHHMTPGRGLSGTVTIHVGRSVIPPQQHGFLKSGEGRSSVMRHYDHDCEQ